MENLFWIVRCGKIFWEGFLIVIIGCLNVGKFSLLNNFLCEEKVIVIDIEGIICDVIEEYVNIKGVFLKLVDIVGICDIDDIVEKIGVECLKKVLEEVDFVLLVFNSFELLIL